ncbi:hypothetical protein GCM10028864_04970 [Microlunatus parietis]
MWLNLAGAINTSSATCSTEETTGRGLVILNTMLRSRAPVPEVQEGREEWEALSEEEQVRQVDQDLGAFIHAICQPRTCVDKAAGNDKDPGRVHSGP